MLAFCCFNPVSVFYFNSFSWDEAPLLVKKLPHIQVTMAGHKPQRKALQNLIQPMKHFFNSTAGLGSQPKSGRMVKCSKCNMSTQYIEISV